MYRMMVAGCSFSCCQCCINLCRCCDFSRCQEAGTSPTKNRSLIILCMTKARCFLSLKLPRFSIFKYRSAVCLKDCCRMIISKKIICPGFGLVLVEQLTQRRCPACAVKLDYRGKSIVIFAVLQQFLSGCSPFVLQC